jgi:hypothetical protein
MRTNSFLLFFLLLSTVLQAQKAHPWSVELNFMRYAKNTGMFWFEDYTYKLNGLNGLDIGRRLSEHQEVFLGVRRLRSDIYTYYGYSGEETRVRGSEFTLGWTYALKPDRPFFIRFGLVAIGAFSTLEGTYSADHPPLYMIAHQKRYLALGGMLGLNFRMSKRALFFATTRYQYGQVRARRFKNAEPGIDYAFDRTFWQDLFDPISALGFRFEI